MATLFAFPSEFRGKSPLGPHPGFWIQARGSACRKKSSRLFGATRRERRYGHISDWAERRRKKEKEENLTRDSALTYKLHGLNQPFNLSVWRTKQEETESASQNFERNMLNFVFSTNFKFSFGSGIKPRFSCCHEAYQEADKWFIKGGSNKINE